MVAGLMVNVINGSGLGSLFHPTLPFSYTLGTFPINQDFGAGVHSFSILWEAPQVLNKPWFSLGGTAYNVGSFHFEKVAGTTKTYRITGERYIINIDPRNGYILYNNPDKPLLAGGVVKIGDIRG